MDFNRGEEDGMCPQDKCEFNNTGRCVKCGAHRPAPVR